MAMLLTAQAGRMTIVIGGKGTCGLAAGSEDLRHAYLHTP